jgi:predicted glycosyltransferase involved in capsule biosynthesis
LEVNSLDSFPEAFKRFEYDVDIGQFESYHQLTLAFRYWAGELWRGTRLQWEALNEEAENLGFEPPGFIREELKENRGYSRGSWRRETLNLRGRTRSVYGDIKRATKMLLSAKGGYSSGT